MYKNQIEIEIQLFFHHLRWKYQFRGKCLSKENPIEFGFNLFTNNKKKFNLFYLSLNMSKENVFKRIIYIFVFTLEIRFTSQTKQKIQVFLINWIFQ